MAKLVSSFSFSSAFRFGSDSKRTSCIVNVEEYRTVYHVSVIRVGFSFPTLVDYKIKKFKTFLSPCDFINHSLDLFYTPTHV